MTAETILMALACIRAPQPQDEYDLHGLVADALQQAEIPFLHEAPLAPRCRIDFLCGEIGIEIKRGRGEKKALEKQLRRYVDSAIKGIETGMFAYFAHPDLFMRGITKFDDNCRAAAKDMAQACRAMRMPPKGLTPRLRGLSVCMPTMSSFSLSIYPGA